MSVLRKFGRSLIVLIISSLSVLPSKADTLPENVILHEGIYYELQKDSNGEFDGTANVVGWENSITDLNIPNEFEIDIIENDDMSSPFFSKKKGVRKVKVIVALWYVDPPTHYNMVKTNTANVESVTCAPKVLMRFGHFGFRRYPRLRSLKAAVSDNEIPDSMFYECKALESITISTEVKSIGASAFEGCERLMNVLLPYKLQYIGYRSFARCNSFKELAFFTPNEILLTIVSEAFDSCVNLETVALPGQISLSGNPFTRCENLKTVDYNAKPYNPRYSFNDGLIIDKQQSMLVSCYNCNVERVTIPSTVKCIGDCAFKYCKKLKSIYLPYTIEDIRRHAFAYSGLESIDTEALESFGEGHDYEFEGCSNLKKVKIGKRFKQFDPLSFYRCPNLAEFVIDNENENFSANNGVLYTKDGSKLICLPGKFAEYSVPDGVQLVGNYAFAGNVNLTNIKMPNSIYWIGDNAFQDCKELKEFVVPEPVYNISYATFADCPKIESLTFGKNVAQLRYYAFGGNTNVAILNVLNPKPPVVHRDDIGEEIFNPEMFEKTIVRVPGESLSQYRSSSLWGMFKNIQALEDSSVDNITVEDTEIRVNNGCIEIIGGDNNTIIKVCDICGRSIYTGYSKIINVTPGLYIVNLDGKTTKIKVN